MPTHKRGLYSFIYVVFGDTLDVNVVSSRFFMPNINDYILLIDEISKLYSDKKKRRENDFFIFCRELELLYPTAIKSLSQKYIIPFLEQFPFLTSPSYLQAVLHRERKETDHSLFLKYVLSQCKCGSSILLDFCNIIGCQSEWINAIKQNTYTVESEFSTKQQRKQSISLRRMDLFIKDEKNKWLIVIENKIDSKIRVEKGNQLDVYKEYCERKYPQYDRLYILLSYRESNFKDIKKRGWKQLHYYSVFNILLQYVEKDDFIKEYLRTLYCLLFPNIQIANGYRASSLFCCWLFINRVILKLNQYAGNFIA